MENILIVKTREEFRTWLINNHLTQKECWVQVKRGKPIENNVFYYLDAVEEALCFGWIDSIWKNIDGKMYSKFTPRKKNSPWTELNKERVRRLERLNLMTDAGRKVLPDMKISSFKMDEDLIKALKENRVYSKFKSFPLLYQRIRAYNVTFYKDWNKEQYIKSLNHLIDSTKKGEMYGEWNDYGRLLEK
jgi:uncharacterized protein YdeI (YjbR/CyaY-like superfamily)